MAEPSVPASCCRGCPAAELANIRLLRCSFKRNRDAEMIWNTAGLLNFLVFSHFRKKCKYIFNISCIFGGFFFSIIARCLIEYNKSTCPSIQPTCWRFLMFHRKHKEDCNPVENRIQDAKQTQILNPPWLSLASGMKALCVVWMFSPNFASTSPLTTIPVWVSLP